MERRYQKKNKNVQNNTEEVTGKNLTVLGIKPGTL